MIGRIVGIATAVVVVVIVVVALTVNRPSKTQVIKDCEQIYTPIRGNLSDAQFTDVLRACEKNR